MSRSTAAEMAPVGNDDHLIAGQYFNVVYETASMSVGAVASDSGSGSGNPDPLDTPPGGGVCVYRFGIVCS